MTSAVPATRSGRDRRAPASGSLDGARRRADQAWSLLQRLVPLACRVTGWIRGLAVAAGVAGLAVAVALGWRLWPWTGPELFGDLLVVGLLAAPVVVLWLFTAALREVLELPDHIQAVPQLATRHGADLADLVRTSRARGAARRGVRGLPGDLWRGGRLLLSTREALPGYGAALTLVSVPFLVATVVSAVAAVLILVLALPVLAGLLVTALL